MVWQYRTILFEFTKDGLLGDRYVDDEEMEKTLNQMGQDSWELVDVSLLQDGLLTFLKRPLEKEERATAPAFRDAPTERITQQSVEPPVKRESAPVVSENRGPVNRPPIGGRPSVLSEPAFHDAPAPLRSYERPTRSRREQDDDDSIGGIRIS